jgi:hypothetical protein
VSFVAHCYLLCILGVYRWSFMFDGHDWNDNKMICAGTV